MEATAAAVARYGARRVGLFLGTSTSGILEAELAYRHRDARTGLLPESFKYERLAGLLLRGQLRSQAAGTCRDRRPWCPPPAPRARRSSAWRERYIARWDDRRRRRGWRGLAVPDDALRLSLAAVDLALPCRPFDVDRDGISIGEAAAFALLEAAGDSGSAGTLALLGVGESSDAHHMSAPHPEGPGRAWRCRRRSSDAGLAAGRVDYINLHGTGTPSNDGAESKAVEALFGTEVPCSSTKGPAATRSVPPARLKWRSARWPSPTDSCPAGINCATLDPACHINYLRTNSGPAPARGTEQFTRLRRHQLQRAARAAG